MSKKYVRGRDKFQKLKPVFSILVKMVKIFPRKYRIKKFNKYCKKGEGLFWVGIRSENNLEMQPKLYAEYAWQL